MQHAELDRLEDDVRDARRRLRSDLEVLRAPGTFSSFKEEMLGEARQSRDDIVADVKEAAADRAERLIADIKERAVANPVAVGAIAAGVAWRILRKPPITTMLIGYGLFSLWRTKPGQPAPGAETVYRAADMAMEAKQTVERWGCEAGDAIARATDVVVPTVTKTVERWGCEAGDAITRATNVVVPTVTKTVERLGKDWGEAVSQATTSARAIVARSSDVMEKERDNVLLGVAVFALTAAFGVACLKRAQANKRMGQDSLDQ